ncbi:uncharacterized protein L969DRAFT_55107 [Mixia osmundae IAM 14324]|uniref:CBS domain-containing protein n=1 Tax=Mixia osmundae (strain CBS 9802 / IAM 14324 / JCM 22182 / KY 12970) TaxID=764103 RepID=G7DV61_MIXOS|nr:uncharacterized protein L969DRAFT_55107 [Mixia osmundae IAM 14324]KEI36313.1 hypothetical protein L969DRAFT_55107 [Mixia osmundae IAM 14324]GAA94471.1 hypothetical protein E5Q_01123 [Mixia osmundae IAM 14324]
MSARNSPAPSRTAGSMVSGISNQGYEVGESSPAASNNVRSRQSKRDEAIRKKIETELARKRPSNRRAGSSNIPQPSQTNGNRRRGGQAGSSRRAAGTVSALRPLPALTVPSTMSVVDASQLCAAKRTDCVLVVDEEEHLSGIFTAKDLAFRVIGDGLDPRHTPVSAIMTKNPMVTRDTTSATDALQTMVTRGFRHLPVCNEEGDVVGLLDITKVFHESLEKLERAYGSSQKLYTALEGVQSEWGPQGAQQASGLMAYVEALRDKMSFPDIGSILDVRTRAATIGVKTTVRDAAKIMRENRTTAVCVLEGDGSTGKLAGIFTSKDVVLRVIAAGLDAKTCSVVRVMTPHPDTASPSLSIQEALRKMHDGHYLNLPVLDDAGALVGCVDVLKLTYATLEQVNSIGAEDGGSGGDGTDGPQWARFFNSFGAGSVQDDNESVFSDPQAASELHPNDSASMLQDDDTSEVGRGANHHASSIGGLAVPGPAVDDGTYLFKFVAPGGTTHRFQARYDQHELIRDIVAGKLASDPFFTEADDGVHLDPSEFAISYHDDDGDMVLMTSDRDVKDAVSTARKSSKDRVVLHLRGGKAWDEQLKKRGISLEAAAPAPPKKISKSIVESDEADDEGENSSQVARKARRRRQPDSDELVFGMPKDMILPAAIGFLGITIIGVFALSRSK